MGGGPDPFCPPRRLRHYTRLLRSASPNDLSRLLSMKGTKVGPGIRQPLASADFNGGLLERAGTAAAPSKTPGLAHETALAILPTPVGAFFNQALYEPGCVEEIDMELSNVIDALHEAFGRLKKQERRVPLAHGR